MRGDGYKVYPSLLKTTGIAESDHMPMDGVVQRVREGRGDEGGVSGLDPIRVRTAHRGWLVR